MNVSELVGCHVHRRAYNLFFSLFLGDFYIKIMPLCICSFSLALLQTRLSLIVVAIVVLNYQGGPPVKSKLPAKRGNLSEFDRLLKTTADR